MPQSKINNLDSITYPTFRNINRLFVLSFKYDNNVLKKILMIIFTWQ